MPCQFLQNDSPSLVAVQFERTQKLLDLVLSAAALIFLSPLLLLTALLVRINLGSPIFFVHPRAGLRGKIFNLIKFRTLLLSDVDPLGNAVAFEKRLTPFGTWLRRMSLDELPQLWNVLKGELSLVGPRPLPPIYLKRYSPEQARRHEVRPGITGWALVNGRNSISWTEKFRLDVWYVDHRSLPLYFKILALTVVRVFRADGVNASQTVPMTEFLGADET